MKFFKTVKEIKSRKGVLHFKRFAIFECAWFGLYIHRIYQADKDPYLHSHPWNFIGLILGGRYLEEHKVFQPFGYHSDVRRLSFGSVLSGNREYFHKISKVNETVTTLFFTYGKKSRWGYITPDLEYIDFEQYRKDKHDS